MKVMILGADGYIGWSVSSLLAYKTDCAVIAVDDYKKRMWQEQVGVSELFGVPSLDDRLTVFKNITNRSNIESVIASVDDYESIHYLIDLYKPDIIINAAQQPSAPYSMISPKTAMETLNNNESTCLNVLWAVARINPNILIISMGSAGVYLNIDCDYIPCEKVNLNFNIERNKHVIIDSWLPMQASDIYHQSKVNTFGLTDIFTKMWNLRSITVQQSTIFGHCPFPDYHNPELTCRLNYDHIFGTVLNRFICQACLGKPLTVYGEGDSKTGIICLCDAVERIIQLIDREVLPGEHFVDHNFSHTYSINELAEKVSMYMNVDVIHITNPRIEQIMKQNHVMQDPQTPSLQCNIDNEILQTLDFVKQFKYNINSNFVYPTIQWSV